MGQPGHLGILLGDTLLRVNHNDAYIAALNSHGGPQDGELLHPVIHLGLLAHTRRVNDEIFLPLLFQITIHRIPGGARHIGHDHPLLA